MKTTNYAVLEPCPTSSDRMMLPHKGLTRALLCGLGLQFVMATAVQTAGASNPSHPLGPDRRQSRGGLSWRRAVGGRDRRGRAAALRLPAHGRRGDGGRPVAGLHGDQSARRAVPGGGHSGGAEWTKCGTKSGLAGTLPLPGHGTVTVAGQTVRFTRPGLVEEYSVSMDGVRQDFVVPDEPAGEGELRVQLAVSGARVESAPYGAQLVLEQSGPQDCLQPAARDGCEGQGTACADGSGIAPALRTPHSALAVVVDDAEAVYPVRIDPTFSDANWISMGRHSRRGRTRSSAAVVDGSGNLYIGGSFTVVGGVMPIHRQMEREQLVGAGFGDGRSIPV